jgi:hypothetical protein
MKKALLIFVGVSLIVIVYFLRTDITEIKKTAKSQIEAKEKKPLEQKMKSEQQVKVKALPDIKQRILPEIENSGIVRDEGLDDILTYETVIVPLIKDSYAAAKNGDWEAFLEYSDEMAQDNSEMPALQLVTAIKQNAPIFVIEQLLENGASWNSSHANIGVRMRNKKEIIEYINLGMDIYVDDKELDNPINAMVRSIYGKSDEKRELFTFLLDSGVEIRKGSDGYHPVTKALIAAKKSEEAVFYIFQMIRREPELTDEQVSLAKELRVDSPRSFSLLVRNVPEFSEVLNE